jgi:hypothetical protein
MFRKGTQKRAVTWLREFTAVTKKVQVLSMLVCAELMVKKMTPRLLFL